MNFLDDIKKFQDSSPQLVDPPKDFEPYWKPENQPIPKYNIIKRAPGTFTVPTNEVETNEEPEEEPLPEITQHPLVTWLENVGVELDIGAYVDNLIDGVGLNTVDDVMLAEPTMEDLISWGFADESDRNKVYYAIHPEKAPTTAAVNERELALFEHVMTKMENNTATDEDLEFFIILKAKLGR